MEKIWANSGDSHYIEAPTFWHDVLPAELADRMPRTEKDEDERWETVYVDGETFRRQVPTIMRKRDDDGLTLVERNNNRRAGGTDITQRLADLDEQGVWGEVVYPSVGMWMTLLKDPVLVREAVKGCNDWVKAEVLDVSPRLIFPARVSLMSAEDAVAEVERCAELGFKAVFLPNTPPSHIPDINDDCWEALWCAIEAAGMVAAFHVGGDPSDLVVHRGPGGAINNWIEASNGAQRAAFKLVSAGVLDRHPGIKVLISEAGAAWVPVLGDRMNEAYRQLGMFVRPKLSLLPKELLYRQVYASFQHDETAVAAFTAMGYRNVIWGSDYPHVEGTFPDTQAVLHELFDAEAPEVRERITIGAFNDLFPHVGAPPAPAEPVGAAGGVA